MGKSPEQEQQQQLNLQISRQQQMSQQQAMQQAQQQYQQQQDQYNSTIKPYYDNLLSQSQAAYNTTSPFATNAVNIGQGALNGQIPQSFLDAFKNPARNAISSAYDGARGNLLESLGRSGQLGSGLSSGPLAGFESQQANAFSSSDANASLQALMQALNLGFQGANVLGGQQSAGLQAASGLGGLYNPQSYYSAGSQAGGAGYQDPRQYASTGSGILGALAGGVGSALGGLATGGLGSLGMASGNLFNQTSSATRNQYANTPNLNQYNQKSTMFGF